MDLNALRARPDTPVAVVAGGASGLGEATVRALHRAGFAVAVLDLPGSLGAALAAELGPGVIFAAADVTSESEIAAALDVAMGLGISIVTSICLTDADRTRLAARALAKYFPSRSYGIINFPLTG